MKLSHPLFPERELPVIPHKGVKSGIGTCIAPVNPAHDLVSLEHAEMFNLSTKGFVDKQGYFKADLLGSEYENVSVLETGNEVVSNLLSDSILTSFTYLHTFKKVLPSNERALMISLDSWFFKLSESLKMNSLSQLALTKFRPKLNMKSAEEVDSDNERLQSGLKSGKTVEVDPYYFNVVEEISDFREWCISEQNYWGIPIPYFTHKGEDRVYTN
jgi:valyl-tRNA synthetase